ncbi:P-loop NTPase fold protein [Streptomyces sp. CA-111067]|uniref:P-loop NTPase fold protein n=1 Tax=Streptomyces sp. CA-111067 TaxID=3240046 RepID=UPI003D968F3D
MSYPAAPTLALSAPAPGSRTFALLNDEPVTDETLDLLGARRASTQLTGLLVASRHQTPLTMAVDAGWGMGKSSLMRLVDTQLRRHREVHTVWYNAWTSTGADALEGLIKSVLMRVDPNILRRALRRVTRPGTLYGWPAR